MPSQEEDLELLLSLQDRVLETPPASPSNLRSNSPGYLSDDGSPGQRREQADLSVFRDIVQDSLDYEPKLPEKAGKKSSSKSSNELIVEKYSGLRIRNLSVTTATLSERFVDVRFVRLTTIKNILAGDSLSGCWATVGVLCEKGSPRTSSVGKSYCIWKFGCLDENTVSLFLFGDAYQHNSTEQVGTVFALFDCNVRKDNMGAGFSLSAYSPNQLLKMGSSADYGVCKGQRKDGMTCTLVINKRQGKYCRYHKSRASEQYSTIRTELKGGNLRTSFGSGLNAEGIYLVDPLANRTNLKNSKQAKQVLSVEGLRKALSKADKVTTNRNSQGLKCLNEIITGKLKSENSNKHSANPNQELASLSKRSSSTTRTDQSSSQSNPPKRTKMCQQQASAETAKKETGKMIELEIYDSDEEI